MQYQSSTIHVEPDDPRFLGGEIITQEAAVEMFGSDLGYPNTYAEDEIPSDEEVEEMIEVGAVRLAVRNRTEDDLAEMRRCVEHYAVADRTDDVQALVGIDYAFHDVILRTAGNQFVSSAVHPYRDALLGARFRATESSEVRSRVDAQHREILEAVEKQDEDRAVSLMQAHMAQTREDILAARERRDDEVSENL